MRWMFLGYACVFVSMAGCVACEKQRLEIPTCLPCLCPDRLKLGPQPGEDQWARAGYPRGVHNWAHPSDTGRYFLYEVGGGSASCRKGEGPNPNEGTWGWDYIGLCLPSKVDLLWHHGKYQGGTGSYYPDGPRPGQRFRERHEYIEAKHEAHESGGHEGGGHEGGGHEGGGHE